jgi:hypothetical protein
MSYSLRVFQHKAPDRYTNTHFKNFNSDNRVTITREDFELLDWETCVFQVYPSDVQVHSFYTLPKGYALRIYNDKTQALLGETSLSDQYIYFKPASPSEDITLRIVLSNQKSLGPEIK